MKNTPPAFSVIIPVFNERENISELYRRLTQVMESICRSDGYPADGYEIIMVDDGSSDGSWDMIKDLHQSDARVKGISFSRNFGHHIAITAGLDYAKGDAVVLMDGDLQDPPEEIPKLYEKYKEGFDIVYAIREKRSDPALKRLTSWIFLRVLKGMANVDIDLGSGIFRIISRRCVQGLKSLREKSRFLTGLMNWVGYTKTGVPTERHERHAGSSKYTLFKLIRLAWHGITSFSHYPLQLSTYLGLTVSFLSFVYGVYLILRKIFFDIPVLGYTSIMVSLFFLGGVILLVLGIIGEYIARIYEEVQNRPLYLIREELDR